MNKLKLGALEDDKPVKISSNFPRRYTAIFSDTPKSYAERQDNRASSRQS